VTVVPEIALTALAVESLAGSRRPAARSARARARAFLLRWQLLGPRLRAALDAPSIAGAFPISPVDERARVDVTAHAVLALLADG
jgi:hypothetical protein